MSYVASGLTGASPIWNKVMTLLLEDKEDRWPPKPAGVIGLTVCSLSGLLPGDSGCPVRFEYFKKGTQPTQTDPGRRQIWIDTTTGQPPKPGQVENLVLEEHLVISDAFITDYCVDCPHDNERFDIKLIPDMPFATPPLSTPSAGPAQP